MEVIRKNWKDNPAYSNLRLLIITPNQWLRDYNGDMKLHFEVREFSSMERLAKRGDILDFFSKLEVLVKEIIQARIFGLFLFSTKADEFEQVLQRAGFYNYLRLLEDWGIISGSLRNKIGKLNKICNQLAHSWDERDVYYDRKAGIRLRDNIVEFREEAKKVWLELIKVHMKAEVKDRENLKVRLEDYNTIPAWNDITKERKSRDFQTKNDVPG